tara:strand:+ start:593 stop:1072 length:480 start_codon:yes stop_codon:yes gene_type:complete
MSIALLTGCDDEGGAEQNQQGIFSIVDNGYSMVLNGDINTDSLEDFNSLYAKYPLVNRLLFRYSEGSLDDEANVALMKRIYSLNIHTHVLDNGLIASGAVDLFLAGRVRSIGTNVKVGVHAWSDGSISAQLLPPDDPRHDLYIQSYESIGFSKSDRNII